MGTQGSRANRGGTRESYSYEGAAWCSVVWDDHIHHEDQSDLRLHMRSSVVPVHHRSGNRTGDWCIVRKITSGVYTSPQLYCICA